MSQKSVFQWRKSVYAVNRYVDVITSCLFEIQTQKGIFSVFTGSVFSERRSLPFIFRQRELLRFITHLTLSKDLTTAKQKEKKQ